MTLKPEFIVIHHNGVAGRRIEDIRRTHVIENEWVDVGYHFVIHEDGTLHRGRSIHMAGAHARGANEVSVGICLIGNGNERPFNLLQARTLDEVCRAAMLVYGIPPENVIGHREVPDRIPNAAATNKKCPGKYADLDAWRRLLGAPTLSPEQEPSA